jgi:non-ribosomal peptide synthetase component F
MLTITLMLRVNLNGAVTFRDLMKQVRDVCLDAYTYQVPPEVLREDLAQRGKERERLFDVWFQLEKGRKEKFDMSGLETVPYMEATEVSRFELSMILAEREKELAGMLEYNEAIFTEKATAHMFDDYFRLLGLMAAEPDREISTISLTRTDEVEELSSAFLANLEV